MCPHNLVCIIEGKCSPDEFDALLAAVSTPSVTCSRFNELLVATELSERAPRIMLILSEVLWRQLLFLDVPLTLVDRVYLIFEEFLLFLEEWATCATHARTLALLSVMFRDIVKHTLLWMPYLRVLYLFLAFTKGKVAQWCEHVLNDVHLLVVGAFFSVFKWTRMRQNKCFLWTLALDCFLL